MKAELYPHQQEALKRLRSGSILCGGVGTGKSRTALAFWEKCGKQNLYIITIPKKRDSKDWEREGSFFGGSAYCKPFSFTVDSWNNIARYQEVRNSFFIFDEQRAIGKGVWSKMFIKIAKKNQWILLTATPGDTWMDYIPVFIANGYFQNRTEFYHKHCVFSRMAKYPKIERYVDTDVLERYRKEILVTMDFKRATCGHVLVKRVDYPRGLYSKIDKDYWNPYAEKPVADMSERFHLLRRASIVSPSRLHEVYEIIRVHRKVVIFYNFDYELDMLRMLDVPYTEWNGHKHEELPEGETWAYLVQYSAGAEAWECTETDTIIFFSLCYSYKTMVQAAGRINRLNTPFYDLYYYSLVSDSSIERRAMQVLSNKQDFNEKAFNS